MRAPGRRCDTSRGLLFAALVLAPDNRCSVVVRVIRCVVSVVVGVVLLGAGVPFVLVVCCHEILCIGVGVPDVLSSALLGGAEE